VPVAPGTIESISNEGVLIAGEGGSLLVRKLQTDGPAQPAHELAAKLGMSQGARFTSPRRA
jgi:hypothetical protein